MQVSWSITLTVLPDSGVDAQPLTRIHLRLRLGSVRRKWLVNTAGELLDILTIAVMAAGLRERGHWPPVEGWSVRIGAGAGAGACDAGSPGVAEMIVCDRLQSLLRLDRSVLVTVTDGSVTTHGH